MQHHVSWKLLCLLVFLTNLSSASGQDAEQVSNIKPGLRGTYRVDATVRRRIDPALAFDWGASSPDIRLPPGPFDARWEGLLHIPRDSDYTISAYVQGKVELSLNGKPVLKGNHKSGGWVSSVPMELEYGHLPLKAEYQRDGEAGTLKIYWQSSQFSREPIGETSLFHLASDAAVATIESGETLVRAFRCLACHEIPMADSPLAAPSLTKIRYTTHPEWLRAYLQAPAHGKSDVTMPDFGISEPDAAAIAAYLTARSETIKLPKSKPGSAAKGKALAEQVGCLACHRIGKLGNHPLFGGGDLSQIAAKRPAGHFAVWLTQPEKLNRDHRMPVIELSKEEVADLATYLQTLGAPGEQVAIDISDPAIVNEGRKLIEAKRCHSCHEIAGFGERQEPRLAWRRALVADPSAGCLAEPDPKSHRPGYRFSNSRASTIATFLTELPPEPAAVGSSLVGRWRLEENNCLACHSRGNANGLRDVVASLGITETKKQAALVPPTLSSVGDKLNEDWLRDAVQGKATRLRPWLAPRMPRFPHSSSVTNELVAHLVGTDRIPPIPTDIAETSVDEQALLFAAQRLVGATGFGCMSCHTIGSYEPNGVELGARGSDLRFLEKRMRQPWFRRWTRNPARIVAGSEMPAITLANPGVLGGNLDQQLDAVWHGLNADSFVLPTADAVQTVTATPSEPVLILRDVFEHGKEDQTTRPFAVSFANGHNLLIDLDTLSIRKWWVGECARQKTRGKTWYWETAGLTLLDVPRGSPMLQLSKNGTVIEPTSSLQAIGRLESFSRSHDAANFSYRLTFPEDIEVLATVTMLSCEEGIRLELSAQGIPSDRQAFFRLPLPGQGSEVRPGQVRLQTPAGPARLAIADAGGGFLPNAPKDDDTAVTFPLHRDGDQAQGAILLATPSMPPKGVPQPTPFTEAKGPRTLPVVPGYEAIRLPLPDGPMPTGIAFRDDGSLVISDLKGGVYHAEDKDADGLADSYRLLSDYLAAPYGLLVKGDDILVSHKHELLRLRNALTSESPHEAEVLATGWGVTADYHDWAVGLVRSDDGSYFISPSCQQDDRSPAAAIGRGKVLEIKPDGTMQEIAAGIRFAMGIARNEAGDVFTTDNQGVTNPFNELNHIRRGHHYGFWSKLEPRPKGQVTTEPAIQIPHPWSRSVNGIAFVPEGDAFGPFAGHLIGAEYTTRGLIRMSLQKVGDTYQGCAYPFSDVTEEQMRSDQTFLGPIAVAFAADGTLYVGSMIDSGWGGGNNRGAIERVKFTGSIPFGIREVRAHADGFEIDFTRPADPAQAGDPSRYSISSYRRIHKGGYETPDQDREVSQVKAARVSEGGQTVSLTVEPMRAGYVYDIAIGKLAPNDEQSFPTLAFYSLNVIPAKFLRSVSEQE